MRGNLKTDLLLLLCIIVSLALLRCVYKARGGHGHTVCETDTVTVYDTIPYIAPTPQSEFALGTRTYTVPKYYPVAEAQGGDKKQGEQVKESDGDIVEAVSVAPRYGTGAGGEPRCSDDIAMVELPIVQRHFADSAYEAWVSGPLDPQLDSLRIFTKTTTITKREWKPPKRWHLGPTIGYGYTPQGFQPYIGVSITYSIISF